MKRFILCIVALALIGQLAGCSMFAISRESGRKKNVIATEEKITPGMTREEVQTLLDQAGLRQVTYSRAAKELIASERKVGTNWFNDEWIELRVKFDDDNKVLNSRTISGFEGRG